jgi:hypothetical protein
VKLKPTRILRGVTVVSLVAAAGLPARAAGSLDGFWDTPLGRVRVEQMGNLYVGRLAEPAKVCGFAKDSEVLHGHFAEEVFSGEVKVCYPPGCREREWAYALAVPVENGEKLLGALSASSTAGCQNLVFKGKPMSLARQKSGEIAVEPQDAPSPGETPPRVRRAMRPEARRLLNEGAALIREGSFERARNRLLAADELSPRSPEILTGIGITFYARNEIPRAKSFYEKAIAADPDFVEAHYNLACALARQRKIKEALKSLKSAIDAGYSDTKTMDSDDDLVLLRKDPGYQDVKRLAERNRQRPSR